MFNYGNFKLFFLKITFGTFLLLLSLIILVSLFSYHHEDPGYGVAFNENEVKNFLGLYGAYLSSILIVFFGVSSYLYCIFFFLSGVKFLFGIHSSFFLLKLIFFIFGIFCINLAISLIGTNIGLSGLILKNLFYNFFELYLDSNYILSICFVLILGIGILSILLSSGIKIKKITNNFLLIIFIKLLKKTGTILFIIPIFIQKIITKKNNNKLNLTNDNKRKEPRIFTHNKKNIFEKKQNNTLNQKNYLNSGKYILPSKGLLRKSTQIKLALKTIQNNNLEFSKKLESILQEYGVEGKIINFKSGPVVTLYEFIPAAGIKTSKVVGLADDIARAMSSLSTRISSQPGKNSIGIEIPNLERQGVYLGDLFNDEQFLINKNTLILALGTDIAGEKIFTDLKKMPHLLIAGTTGSGKSVGINGMILSLLYRFAPSECKLILIDPKMLELSIYEGIPHLLTPVVTDPKKAVFALKWVVREMEDRYKLMSSLNVKNIDSYNSKILKTLSVGKKLFREVQTGFDRDTRKPIIEKREISLKRMPLIVVVIDEMADLMMVAGKEVENLVQRLAQMARASGIHLITATQRPSVDVITGTIKANFPSRISYRVASRFDSRTILNEMGAEQLLGSGDMLFLENGANLKRLHGGYVSEKEIEDVVNHIKYQESFKIDSDIVLEEPNINKSKGFEFEENDVDELYGKAVDIVIEQQKISTSFIQRYLQIGYNRAARIVEKMEENGLISEANNSGKRSVLKKN